MWLNQTQVLTIGVIEFNQTALKKKIKSENGWKFRSALNGMIMQLH